MNTARRVPAWVCVVVALLATCAQGWLVIEEYSDTSCTTKELTYIYSPGCLNIGVGLGGTRIYCSGNGVIVQSCSDDACNDCVTADLGSSLFALDTCTNKTGAGHKYSCPSSFPSPASSDLVQAAYFNSKCTGNPAAWSYSSFDFSGVDLCSIYPGTCTDATDSSNSDSEFDITYSYTVTCGKKFKVPSGSGKPASNCSITAGSCDFYLTCVENTVACDSSDYAIAFGYQYCSNYSSNSALLTPASTTWVNSVLTCLQQTLLPVVKKTPTCATIRTDALASHSTCLTQPTVCFSSSDWSAIMTMVWGGVASADVSLDTVLSGSCFQGYAVPQVWKVTNVVGETYSSLLSKLAALANTTASSVAILDSTIDAYLWASTTLKRSVAYTPANVTFTLYASTTAQAQTHATAFNTQFATQTYWTGASATACASSSSQGCASTSTKISGSEPSGDSGSGSGSKGSTASSVVLSSAVVAAAVLSSLLL